MKVSIIMPVYNSEMYLRGAVDSVLAQDFDDFELILVDDGSPDNSGAICDAYAKEHANVRVLHKENGGICSARNAGMKLAQGEYIGFCDNDDEFLPGLLKDNYTYAKEHDVDLMRFNMIKRLVRDDGKTWETSPKLETMCVEREHFPEHYDNIRRVDTVWTGLYRRELIEKYDVKFDESFRYGLEDMYFNLVFLKYCQRLGVNEKAYYVWAQRDTHSTSRSFKRDYLKKNMINLQLEYEFMTEICQGKLENKMKNVFLVNSYVQTMIQYMLIKNCSLTLKEKCQYLKHMRRHAIFDKRIPRETLRAVRKDNKRLYITMWLFDRGRYASLFLILKYGTGLLAKFRYKA